MVNAIARRARARRPSARGAVSPVRFPPRAGRVVLLVVALCAVLPASPAAADDFLPHPAGRAVDVRLDRLDLQPAGHGRDGERAGPKKPAKCGWQLAWSGLRVGADRRRHLLDGRSRHRHDVLPRRRPSACSTPTGRDPCRRRRSPSLCAPASGSACPNSLGSVLYDVIWGGRSPVLSEPLLQGLSWGSRGGADGSVSSTNDYLGLRRVTVPAFPHGVTAAVVRSQITLAGTPGDDYGSGTRTIWWVRGVGPVKLELDHVDGSVTRAQLLRTNQAAAAVLPDQDFFPLRLGPEGHLPLGQRQAPAGPRGGDGQGRGRRQPLGAGHRAQRLGPAAGGRATTSSPTSSTGCATPTARPRPPPWSNSQPSGTGATSSPRST